MKDETLGKKLRKRSWATTKLAAQLGIAAASKTLGIELPRSNEQAVKKAVALASQFDGMKGLMLKFGQMASYLNTSLPPEAQQILAQLQASATAMPFATIAQQIESDLGAPVSTLFDSFEENAFAAASIGQVHRAVLHGQPVAVKVQYPGIRALIENDLGNVGLFAKLLLMGSAMDSTALSEELRARVLEECDYALEAQRQAAVGAVWNTLPGRSVPQVFAERSGNSVITSSLQTGARFTDYLGSASAESRRHSSLLIFDAVFDGIFHRGFFNGDPHPGNFLFHANGDVVFLDFGCLRSFDDEFLLHWKRMAGAVLDGNRTQFRDAFIAMGMVGNAKKLDWDLQWDMMRFLYEPFRSAQPFRYSRDYIRECHERILWQNRNRWHLSLPPNQLFVNRLQWGLYSVLADLNAEALYRDLFRAAVEAPVERIPGLR